jgi:hypothetical protein
MKEIILFGKALEAESMMLSASNSIPFVYEGISIIAIKKGYIVHPNCNFKRVIDYLDTLPNDYSSTFYQSWDKVISKNRNELLHDQVLHYMSTYGTNFQGIPYVPNESSEVINFKDAKILLPISIEEVGKKIQAMFNSGIALKGETIVMCLELIEELKIDINYDSVKNKEVMMFIHKLLGTLPSSAEEMVRFLVYLHIDKTLLIKDKQTIQQIKRKSLPISGVIETFGIEKLASVFHRYKPLFLAMKKGNEVVINKLRRLADKHHQPKQFGFWSQILSDVSLFPKIEEQLVNLNNFKLISLLNTILMRKEESGILASIIRNGKYYVTERNFNNRNYYTMVYSILYDELITRLKKKACKVKLDSNISLTLPTSEKSFVGHLPIGSNVALDQDAIVGVNWKGVNGAQDIDLSLIDISGNKFGWNSHYYNSEQTVVYSGDMTSANPEATELLYAKQSMPDGIVFVNMFRGNEESKFTLFFAEEFCDGVETNHMVDPNNIVFSTEIAFPKNEKQLICGMFVEKKFFFMNIQTSGRAVSGANEHQKKYLEHMKKNVNSFLELKDVLEDAGFKIVKNNPDLDLSVPDKSALIELLKGE